MKYSKCGLTYSDLNKYRDENGYIDLDKINIRFDDETREKMGNEEREKNWIELADGKRFLAKEELKFEGKRTASIYSELIIAQLAEQVGLKHANCDLYKKDGKFGVLSENILNEGEEMFSLNFLVGDNSINSEHIDVADLFELEKKLAGSFKVLGLNKKQALELMVDFQKQLVFDMFVGECDRHTENISLMLDTNTGKYDIAPMYDNETSLLLDCDMDTLKELTSKPSSIKDVSELVYPKIALMPEKEDPNSDDIWKYTFDQLIADDDTYDFAMDCYEKLDIKAAIKSVEEKIRAPIPYEVTSVATIMLNERKKSIDDIMINGIEYCDENEYKKVK